ncbi:MAG: ATP-binding protein [Bacteroidota bacterium]
MLLPLYPLANPALADSLMRTLELPQHDTSRILTLHKLSETFLSNDIDRAIGYSLEALELAKNFPEYLTESQLLMGRGYLYNGELALSQQFIEEGMIQAEIDQDHKLLGSFYNCLAAIQFTKAEIEEANISLDTAEFHAKKAGNKREQISIYNSKAIIYGQRGFYNQAIISLQQAVRLCDDLGMNKEAAAILNNLGDIYKEIGQLPDAYKTFLRALELVDPATEGTFHTVIAIGLAEVLLDLYEESGEISKLDSASQFNSAALAYAQKTGHLMGVIYGHINEGRILLIKELPGHAKNAFQKGLDASEEQGADHAEHIVKRYIGEAYMDMGMPKEAIRLFKESLEQTKSLKLVNAETKNYLKLAKAYETIGNNRMALQYFKHHHRLKDSLFSAEKSKQLAELNVKYQSTEKEKENQRLRFAQELNDSQIREKNILFATSVIVVFLLLILSLVLFRLIGHKENANELLLEQKLRVENHNRELGILNEQITLQHKVITAKNANLAKLNKEKDQLLSVITHDIRSPMLMLQETLKMINKSELSEQELFSLTKSLAAKVSDTSHFIDNLLNWVVAQVKGIEAKPEKLDVPQLLEDVLIILNDSALKKNISLVKDIKLDSNIYLDVEMMKVILRNLLANAIKFTPDSGKIHIQVLQRQGLVSFTVKDSGVGMDPEQLTNLFDLERISTLGTDAEKGTGLGLVLTRNFVERMGGTIKVSSTPGEGSTFHILVPNRKEKSSVKRKIVHSSQN